MSKVSKKKQPEAALGYPFRAMLDDGVYFIQVPDLPGCMTVAESPDEIVPMVTDAVRAWTRAARKHGLEVPSPGSSGDQVFPWPGFTSVSPEIPPAIPQPAASKNGGQTSGNGRSRTGEKPKSGKATV